MKYTAVLAVATLSLAVVACGSSKDASKANFAAAIDKALAERCIALSVGGYNATSSSFPAALEEMQPGMFTSAEHARDRNQAMYAPWEALAKAGLVIGTSGPVKRAFGNGTVPGRTYALTPAGQSALKAQESMTFCAGHKKVKEIVRYTEPGSAMGATVSEARYTTEAVDVPAWARVPAVQQAFPDFKAALDDTRERRASLVLNNDGWEAKLSPF